MKVIEPKLGAACPDIVDTASEADLLPLSSFSRLDDALFAILANVVGQRGGDMELVRVRVGGLGLLELQDLARADLKVLLEDVILSMPRTVSTMKNAHIGVQLLAQRVTWTGLGLGRGRWWGLVGLCGLLSPLLGAPLELPADKTRSTVGDNKEEV